MDRLSAPSQARLCRYILSAFDHRHPGPPRRTVAPARTMSGLTVTLAVTLTRGIIPIPSTLSRHHHRLWFCASCFATITCRRSRRRWSARLAQLPKLNVVGSIPITRSSSPPRGWTDRKAHPRVPMNSRPKASSAAVGLRMRRTPRRDNPLELSIRRLVHAKGLRFRVDSAPVSGLRRRADILFTAARVAAFVDGCFWHCCPRHATWPRANAAWWKAKLLANVARDRDTDARLRRAGWRVVRIWEHEDPGNAADRLAEIVRRRSKRPRRSKRRGVGAGEPGNQTET